MLNNKLRNIKSVKSFLSLIFTPTLTVFLTGLVAYCIIYLYLTNHLSCIINGLRSTQFKKCHWFKIIETIVSFTLNLHTYLPKISSILCTYKNSKLLDSLIINGFEVISLFLVFFLYLLVFYIETYNFIASYNKTNIYVFYLNFYKRSFLNKSICRNI